MTGDYALTGLSVPGSLDRLHDLLEQAGRDHPAVGERDLMLFQTAVAEIAGNVIEHGRPLREVRWSFRLWVRPDRLDAELADSGQTYAGDMPPPMAGPGDESGRGLALASATLDTLDYRRVGNANIWRMSRRRSPG